MRKILLFVSVAAGLLAVSCADGLYGDISDKNTKEALRDKGDFAFIQGNCRQYISMYEQKADANLLSSSELYKYNNSLLACSGFDLVGSLSGLLGAGGLTGDPFGIIQNLMGTSALSAEESARLKESYGKILKTCQPAEALTENLKTVCGMTAAADTVRLLGDVALNVSGNPQIGIDEAGMKEAIAGKSETEITKGVTDTFGGDLSGISSNLELISGAADTIQQQAGGGVDISKSLSDFTSELKDSSGQITETSLTAYINGKFGNAAAAAYVCP